MNKICVYAICKNESQFVDRWVDSMQEADEIVVLDTAGNRIALRYATAGVINDWKNEQHLKLSQEENDQIKTILAQYITVND